MASKVHFSASSVQRRSRVRTLDEEQAGSAEEQVTEITGNEFSFDSLFPDYTIEGLGKSGEAAAVIIGTLLVLGIGLGLSRVVARKE